MFVKLLALFSYLIPNTTERNSRMVENTYKALMGIIFTTFILMTFSHLITTYQSFLERYTYYLQLELLSFVGMILISIFIISKVFKKEPIFFKQRESDLVTNTETQDRLKAELEIMSIKFVEGFMSGLKPIVPTKVQSNHIHDEDMIQ